MNPIPRSHQTKFRPCPQCGGSMFRLSAYDACSECRSKQSKVTRTPPVDRLQRQTKLDALQQRAALGLPLFEERP